MTGGQAASAGYGLAQNVCVGLVQKGYNRAMLPQARNSIRSLSRRMPSSLDPESPRFDHQCAIHVQPRHRGTPDWRQAENPRSLVIPAEMLLPVFDARVK